MSTRLVLLGLLRERPLYGYELKQIIEEHMGDWTNIAFGSIYFALNKLADEGFIEQVATEQEGNRPSRTVYQITHAGRAEFLSQLKQVWRTFQQQYFDLDIALFFMDALPPDEVRSCLRARVAQLEQVVAHLNVHQGEEMSKPEVPARAAAIFDHARRHIAAELAWTQDLLAKVEQGFYS
ncbi:MAG: PadR family transcriptional regulator [Anaerolineae bacterium]|nr:PadR family transcriptional regulator [Anaerolineae bacterium]